MKREGQRARACGIWLLALLLSASARGRGEEPLKLELRLTSVRTNSPLLVRAKFTRSTSRVLEGRLELVINSGNALLAVYRSPELALASDEQTFDLVLPAIGGSLGYANQVDVHARFVGPHAQIEFPPIVWPMPAAGERSCVVAVSQAREDWDERFERMRLKLGIHTLNPKPRNEGRSGLTCIPVTFAPGDLPSHPLAYCAFDLVLLPGKGFTSLRQNQLDAVLAWVRAGGSACIVPPSAVPPRLVAFLNALVGQDGPVYALDSEGHLQPAGAAPRLLRVGLGRAAVVLEPPRSDAELASATWRNLVAFLWKVRREQLPRILASGTWELKQGEGPELPYSEYDPYRRGWANGEGFDTLRICDPAQVVSGLMPRDVRVIPFGVIVLILAGFVVVVGPLDYFVLGLLRRRKLTWVVFPLVAALFTLFTVKLAYHYMGRQDFRRGLVFVDVDCGGRPLRVTRFEMLFAASERTVRHDLRNCLFHPMETGVPVELYAAQRMRRRRSYSTSYRTQPGYYDAAASDEEAGPLVCEGRVPGAFSVAQRIPQWKPVLNRSLSLEPPAREPGIRWDAVSARDFGPHPDLVAVSSKLFAAERPGRIVCLFHGNALVRTSVGVSPAFDFLLVTTRYTSWPLLQMLSAHPQMGLFRAVSQVSPTGAPNFEDLAIFDPTDPSEWLLCVVEQVGDDIYVYRCLYHGES